LVTLVGLMLCCATRSGHARRHNDLEGHRNFSSTIYNFSICALNITTVEINSGVYFNVDNFVSFVANSFRYLYAKNYLNRTWFDKVNEKIKWVQFLPHSVVPMVLLRSCGLPLIVKESTEVG